MLMHEFMQRQVQLLSYLDSGYIYQTIELPTAQEKSEQIFFTQPVCREMNKMVTTYLLWLITFFLGSVRLLIKWSASLTRSRRKNNRKRRRWLIFRLLAASESSYWQHHCKNYNYQGSVRHYWDDQQHDSCHQDN